MSEVPLYLVSEKGGGACDGGRARVRDHKRPFEVLISEAPRSGPLALAPVSAKELKEREFQGAR